MKTITRDMLGTSPFMYEYCPGYACPRCRQEDWYKRLGQSLEEGWCGTCAESCEPLKIVEPQNTSPSWTGKVTNDTAISPSSN